MAQGVVFYDDYSYFDGMSEREMSYEELMEAIKDQPEPIKQHSAEAQRIETDPNLRIVATYGSGEKVERFGVVLDENGRSNLKNEAAKEAFDKGWIRFTDTPEGRRVGLTKKGSHYLNELAEDEAGQLRSLDIDPRAHVEVRTRLIEAIKDPVQRILNTFTARYKTYLRDQYGLEFEVEEELEEGRCRVYLMNVRNGGKNSRSVQEDFVIPCQSDRVFKQACTLLHDRVVDRYNVLDKNFPTKREEKNEEDKVA